MSRQLNMRYIVALFIALAMMNITIIPLSIQYMQITTLSLIAITIVLFLYQKGKEKHLPLIMLIVGMLSAFFDLLSYPLMTLGFSLIVIMLLENKKQEKSVLQLFKMMGIYSLLWGLGYGATFLGKWILASIVLHKNTIVLALNQILFRANGNTTHIVKSRWDPVKLNFTCYFNSIALSILTVIEIIWIFCMIFYRKKIRTCKIIIPLCIIAILPYIWYFLLAEHSLRHNFFTFRLQAITCFSLLSAMFSCIKCKKMER